MTEVICQVHLTGRNRKSLSQIVCSVYCHLYESCWMGKLQNVNGGYCFFTICLRLQ